MFETVNMCEYFAPEVFIFETPLEISTPLCSSPVPGGNEGLIYEDWGNGGN